MFYVTKRKTDLEIKIEQIVVGNPQDLRTYLISEGYRSESVANNAGMKAATMHLVKCNPDVVPTLLSLHPDFKLFSEVSMSLQPKATEMQSEALPSVNVEVNTTNGQFEIENNNKMLIIQKQNEEIQHLRSFIQNHATPQVPMPTPMPTPSQAPAPTQNEELYIDVQDVCVYGIKIKHWIIGIIILLVTAITVTAITFKDKND